jgi:nucleoside phosphorylase
VTDPRELGCSLKDMEGAAIAHVCEINKVPCRMLKAISDVHGKGSMTNQYQVNLAKALGCLKDAVTSWM